MAATRRALLASGLAGLLAAGCAMFADQQPMEPMRAREAVILHLHDDRFEPLGAEARRGPVTVEVHNRASRPARIRLRGAGDSARIHTIPPGARDRAVLVVEQGVVELRADFEGGGRVVGSLIIR